MCVYTAKSRKRVGVTTVRAQRTPTGPATTQSPGDTERPEGVELAGTPTKAGGGDGGRWGGHFGGQDGDFWQNPTASHTIPKRSQRFTQLI